jgi:N-acetylglutamate synthase-like GNAT family acetyltransferase
MMPEITIHQNKNLLDLDMIHNFLSTAYWSIGRSKSEVQTTIENSLCFGVYLDTKQIGFARVVSDQIVFAYVMDVFILPEYRDRGYGHILVDFMLNAPELKHVQKWLLATSNAHELYAQFGFKAISNPGKLMAKGTF